MTKNRIKNEIASAKKKAKKELAEEKKRVKKELAEEKKRVKKELAEEKKKISDAKKKEMAKGHKTNIKKIQQIKVEMTETHNKGTGAGGSTTNHNGLAFETKTCNEHRLLLNGFVRKNIPKKEKTKYGYYLEKIYDNHSIHFVMQNGLKYYMREFHQKELFREVDEAYIFIDNITNNITVKILEKKNQNNSGSVEDKLCLGHHFKFVEYPSCLGEKFQVEYAFCISIYLRNLYNSDHTKWKIIKESNEKNNIPVLFGDDDDYYSKLDEWINS
jgi:hypothetical protein